MEVTVVYSKTQLEKAVQFIGHHNRHFIGQFDTIRGFILRTIQEMTQRFPNAGWLSTAGYTVVADVSSVEGMDNDENKVYYEIWVDPSIGDDSFMSDGDAKEEIMQFPAPKETESDQ